MAEEELKGEEKIRVMIESLKSHQIFVRSTATEQLTIDITEDPDFVLPMVIKEIADPEWWTVRFGVTEAIQEAAVRGLSLSDNYVKELLQFTKDPDEEYRAKLASCLGDVKNKLAVPALIDLLKAENDEIRENAAIALGKIKDEQSTQVLMNQIANDTSEYVKSACIESIGNMLEGKRVSVDIKDIAVVLRNENPSIQSITAVALGKIRNPACIIPLIKAMNPIRRDINAESRQDMLDTLLLFSEEEILSEIKNAAQNDENLYLDLLDEVLFQNPFELLQKESETNKQKLIPKYQRQFKRVKNEIDSINSFVADVFKNLASINTLEEIETIRDTIPRKRKNLEKIDVTKISSYAWVNNSLYLELKEAEKNFKLGIAALVELENAVEAKYEKLKAEQVPASTED